MAFPLNERGEQDLRDLVTALEARDGPWYEVRGGAPDERGAAQMPYHAWHPLVSRAYTFLSDWDLDIVFDWPRWEEGREFFRSEDPGRYAALDDVTVRKLLTAVVRNERFHEGAWPAACESGEVTRLLRRLLELQESAQRPAL